MYFAAVTWSYTRTRSNWRTSLKLMTIRKTVCLLTRLQRVWKVRKIIFSGILVKILSVIHLYFLKKTLVRLSPPTARATEANVDPERRSYVPNSDILVTRISHHDLLKSQAYANKAPSTDALKVNRIQCIAQIYPDLSGCLKSFRENSTLLFTFKNGTIFFLSHTKNFSGDFL